MAFGNGYDENGQFWGENLRPAGGKRISIVHVEAGKDALASAMKSGLSIGDARREAVDAIWASFGDTREWNSDDVQKILGMAEKELLKTAE